MNVGSGSTSSEVQVLNRLCQKYRRDLYVNRLQFALSSLYHASGGTQGHGGYADGGSSGAGAGAGGKKGGAGSGFILSEV